MKEKILFINLTNTSFVRNDIKILDDHFDLKVFKFKHKKGFRVIIELIRELFFLLGHLRGSDIIYVWFADFHAVLPSLIGRLFGKKVVIVIGGFDAAYIKEYNYGVKARAIGRISVNLSTRYATHLLAVTDFSRSELLRNINPALEKKTDLIPNCVNDFFSYDESNQKKERAVCVALGSSVNRLKIKGVDYFVDLAANVPEKEFLLIGLGGSAKDYVDERKTNNLTVLGPVSHQELSVYLAESKVICQLSRYESFGIAVLEGINSGCFPVGNNYAGTAEVLAGTEAFLVDVNDMDAMANAVRIAFDKEVADSLKIAEILKEKYAYTVREKALVNFINDLRS